MDTITQAIQTNEIVIVSGEGEQGTREVYTGKRSIRAIKLRLGKERRGGRWARAEVYDGQSQYGDRIYVEVETGEMHLR
ncbi:MAG: hypothetical protein IPI57_15840 [Candidatus Competibacteraceae bacterium]|nr:hypothetical protein [Candidatus Competibacteraceae bacterium]MBK7543187.1 hypothetical protein [Candidatus Competibacteraceae bacterium]